MDFFGIDPFSSLPLPRLIHDQLIFLGGVYAGQYTAKLIGGSSLSGIYSANVKAAIYQLLKYFGGLSPSAALSTAITIEIIIALGYGNPFESQTKVKFFKSESDVQQNPRHLNSDANRV